MSCGSSAISTKPDCLSIKGEHPMANVTADAVISQGEDQVHTIVDGQAVVMSIDTGKYYSLDAIGTRIWSLIEKPQPVAAVCDQLVQEFEVERNVCEADVLALLERLSSENLIQVAAAV